MPEPHVPDAGALLAVPTLSVGDDALRFWDRLPYQRIGTRTYMRSTYDRTGGNEAADASHFLRQTTAFSTALDVVGSGVLRFARANRWHGSPWHYVVDGADTVVSETNTMSPDAPTAPASWLPAAAFPSPLAVTWPETQGADASWVSVPFARALTIGYARTHYGTGYFIYDLYPAGATNLSQPLSTWKAGAPAADVVALVGRSGEDLSPAGAARHAGTVSLAPGESTPVASLDGSFTLRSLRFTVPRGQELAFGKCRLRITWDGRALPSVDAPVALFFGAGTLYNRDDRRYLVQAFLTHIRFDAATVELATYFPMPFFRSAKIELVGTAPVTGVSWEAKTVPFRDPPSHGSYFHATYKDHGIPRAGQDLVLLDTTKDEGGGSWSGVFAGTSFIFSQRGDLTTLEGDPRFFFDDSKTPQAQGTGTEEWGAGGDYWNGGQSTTLPFAGHPVGAPSGMARSPEDAVESAYRLLVSDAMPFGRNARIQLEHGGVDQSVEHYETVAYWYGLPGESLVATDSLHVSDPADESAHAYVQSPPSAIDTLTSRYEWGVDHVGSMETYPAETDTGRHTTGTSEFTLTILPRNYGVLLRRKLDYAFPDQMARVFVADARPGARFVLAGTWYLAGSSTCVFSDPPAELGAAQSTAETSDHRFRDDELMIPRQLTEGRSRIRVRVAFVPTSAPLAPGAPPAPRAWSEYRYTAYAWVLPPSP